MIRWQDWLSIISIAFVGLTLVRAYLRQSAIVPASRVEELHRQNEELRGMNGELRALVADLRETIKLNRMTIEGLRMSEQYLQEEVRRLRARNE